MAMLGVLLSHNDSCGKQGKKTHSVGAVRHCYCIVNYRFPEVTTTSSKELLYGAIYAISSRAQVTDAARKLIPRVLEQRKRILSFSNLVKLAAVP